MSLVLFDSTQFVTFDLTNGEALEVRDVINEFKDQGFSVLDNSEIKQKKLTYLSKYLSSEVVELEQSEFLGEFEDWKDKEEIPIKVLSLSNSVKKLANSGCVNNLKVILIEYASEDKERDHIHEENVNITELPGKLFLASKSCFDVWANVMVFCVSS